MPRASWIWIAPAGHGSAPRAVAARGLEAMTRLGTLEIGTDGLVLGGEAGEGSPLLQNAETARLVGEKASVPVASLAAGDRILVHHLLEARHFRHADRREHSGSVMAAHAVAGLEVDRRA